MNNQGTEGEPSETSPQDDTSATDTSIASVASGLHPMASTDSKAPSPGNKVIEGQIAVLRVELETKEASHALLTLQFTELEKHYKNQEDQLKSEITSLREQQKQEDEPRQLAKAKLKELQESLREAVVHKTKVEKEHRVELDKRQRVTEQLEAKQKKLESLKQTLRQSEEKLRTEKEAHQCQIKELEEALKKRSEDVRITESSLLELQESQKSLSSTIESKEIELQKLQATLHPPKGYVVLEQKIKDLDHKCAELTKQLDQYKAENMHLQEKLAEAARDVIKVRSAPEPRKVESEAWKASRVATPELQPPSTMVNHSQVQGQVQKQDQNQNQNRNQDQNQDQEQDQSKNQTQSHESSWLNTNWGFNTGATIMNEFFQEAATAEVVRPTISTRKTAGPPPGLTQKVDASVVPKMNEPSASVFRRDSTNSASQGSSVTPSSPSRTSGLGNRSSKPQRKSSGLHSRSTSTVSVENLSMDDVSGMNNRYNGMMDSSFMALGDIVDPTQEARYRTSSSSSITGFQSPLFEPSSLMFSSHGQHQQDPIGTSQFFPQTTQNRLSTQGRQQHVQGSMSPRTRFQGSGQYPSPPATHPSTLWGGQPPVRTKSGPMSAVGANRSSLTESDVKAFQNSSTSQPFNYYFGQQAPMDKSCDIFSDNGSMVDHPPLNEQSVIKSMFESSESLDLRHHLRTVGSHSSLGAQSKILPPHLRSTSNPGTSPRLSPTVSTQPYQPSPSWDLKPIARPGTLGRMHSQAESSSSSLNISNPSSPTSPQTSPFSQGGSGFGRKALHRDSGERGHWGGYHVSDVRNRGHDNVYVLQSDYNLVTLVDESRLNSRWPTESRTHDSLPMADPWGQGEGRFKSNRLSVTGNREVQAGVGMEGMLPSPTGSSGSSMDMGTPLSVDALVFADHYFSHRNHRGFDAPSALSSVALPATTAASKQPSMDTRLGLIRTDKAPQAMEHSTAPLESDIFG
ncbi:hypothetical protein BGZ65_001591, partial [Modicella reniformis]